MIKNDKKYKILTPDGWAEFDGIKKISSMPTLNIILKNGNIINCTADHNIYIDLYTCIEANKLKIDDWILTKNGLEQIKDIQQGEVKDVYDILNVSNGNRFFANDILVNPITFDPKSSDSIATVIMNFLQGTYDEVVQSLKLSNKIKELLDFLR